jgi:glycosyltransferase involved in cell wall biosynthesis
MSLSGRRALFISYNGMLDPLGQSQVLPYLRELSKEGVTFTLLSFERAAAFEEEGLEKCRRLEEELAEDNIEWHRLKYHKRFSLGATAYDVARGTLLAESLIKRNRIEVVHARNPIMATIGLPLKRRLGVKLIFDVRGLLADEYVDAGHWQKQSIKYWITKKMELKCLTSSDGIVTLTEVVWPEIKKFTPLLKSTVPHEVIPCCVDLERFKFDAAEREKRRAELNLHGKFVVVYSGSIGGWYMVGEMIDFFSTLLEEKPDSHFLWLTPGSANTIRDLMRERQISESSYSVVSADPKDVASYLSASDASISFIRPCFSKLGSSPTKTAEYLACGLPLIINAGIGDSDTLVTEEEAGALVRNFSVDEYREAARTVMQLAGMGQPVRDRMRSISEKLFDVERIGRERYTRLYQRVLAGSDDRQVIESVIEGVAR